MKDKNRRKHPAWQRRHDGVLLYFLQNPSATQLQCAEATGYSVSQISRIVNSSYFLEKYKFAIDSLVRDFAYKSLTSKT